MHTMLQRRLTPPWASSRGTLDLHLKLQKETAYKTFVRPILEYASTSWAPFNDTDNGKIEKVQRRAARFVMNDYRRTSSVIEMLTNLDWDTLQERRDLARLSMMYRIVHGLVDISAESYLTPSTSTTSGHNSRFRQIRTSNSTYQQSFFPRGPLYCGTNSLRLPRARQRWRPSRTSWLPTPTKRHTMFLPVFNLLTEVYSTIYLF